MALACTNALTVLAKRIALLIAGGDDVLKLFEGKRLAVGIHCLQQFVHTHPARLSQLQPHPLRLMPENQAEEFASSDCFFICHKDDPSNFADNDGHIVRQCARWIAHQFNQPLCRNIDRMLSAGGVDPFCRRVFEQPIRCEEKATGLPRTLEESWPLASRTN